MTTLLFIALAFAGDALPVRWYSFTGGFNAYILEYQATTPTMARKRAKSIRLNETTLNSLRGLFTMSRKVPSALKSVRLGVWADGIALVVDRDGFARLNGSPGRFDVLAFEKLAGRSSAIKGGDLWFKVRVRNESNEVVTLVDSAGLSRLRIPGGAADRCEAWLCDYKVFAGHTLVARMSALSGRVVGMSNTRFLIHARPITGPLSIEGQLDMAEASGLNRREIEWIVRPTGGPAGDPP